MRSLTSSLLSLFFVPSPLSLSFSPDPIAYPSVCLWRLCVSFCRWTPRSPLFVVCFPKRLFDCRSPLPPKKSFFSDFHSLIRASFESPWTMKLPPPPCSPFVLAPASLALFFVLGRLGFLPIAFLLFVFLFFSPHGDFSPFASWVLPLVALRYLVLPLTPLRFHKFRAPVFTLVSVLVYSLLRAIPRLS